MSDSEKTPVSTPKGLGLSGRRLWKDVAAKYDLRPDELRILESACKTTDMIVRLEDAMEGQPATIAGSRGQQIAHPLLAEIRLQRVTFAGLLKAIKLPDDGTGAAVNQQRTAATSRWANAYGTR